MLKLPTIDKILSPISSIGEPNFLHRLPRIAAAARAAARPRTPRGRWAVGLRLLCSRGCAFSSARRRIDHPPAPPTRRGAHHPRTEQKKTVGEGFTRRSSDAFSICTANEAAPIEEGGRHGLRQCVLTRYDAPSLYHSRRSLSSDL